MKTKKDIYTILSSTQLDLKTQDCIDNAESLDDVAAILRENGIDISVEDLEVMFDNSNEELQEEDLDVVSGGCLIWLLEKIAQRRMKKKTGKKHKCSFSSIDGMVCEVKK